MSFGTSNLGPTIEAGCAASTSAPGPSGRMSSRDHEPVEKPWPALAVGAVHVWRFRLDRSAEQISTLHRELDAAERARADRFAFERDRSRYVVAHGSMRRLLGRYLRRDPVRIRFQIGAHGKPALSTDAAAADPEVGANFQFNLSHSDDIALLAVANGLRVGADVEVHRPLPDAEQIAASVFSPDELARWRCLKPSERLHGFFDGWTRKEAFVKALGVGLSMAPSRFEVTLGPGRALGLVGVGRDRHLADGWTLIGGEREPGVSSAIAVESTMLRDVSFFRGEPP